MPLSKIEEAIDDIKNGKMVSLLTMKIVKTRVI